MRIRCDLLRHLGSEVPVAGLTGPLWQARLDWQCADGRLDLRILASEPLDLPRPESSEPVPGAIARVLRAIQGTHALALLANPAEALGPERIPLAEGVRLIGIASEADLACWDAALTRTVPMYGVRGEVLADLVRAAPVNLLSCLAYGGFLCSEGLEPVSLLEDRTGVRWELPEMGEATAVIRGGFEAERQSGREGYRPDQGNEGVVRFELSTPAGRCWTQPRFIAPRRS